MSRDDLVAVRMVFREAFRTANDVRNPKFFELIRQRKHSYFLLAQYNQAPEERLREICQSDPLVGLELARLVAELKEAGTGELWDRFRQQTPLSPTFLAVINPENSGAVRFFRTVSRVFRGLYDSAACR